MPTDLETIYRSKTLFYIIAVLLVLHTIGVTAANLIKLMDPTHLVVSISVGLGFLSALLSLVSFKKPNWAINILAITMVYEVAAYGYLNGGLFSPTVALLITFPVFAVVFVGERGGRWALVVSLALILGLFIAGELHWVHPPTLGESEASRVRGILYALLAALLYVLGLAFDSSRKQLQVASVELSRISDLGTLADGVSHEINNPLTVIVNSVGILKKRMEVGDLTPELKKLAFDSIQVGVSRIVEITQLLNTLSQSGKKAPFENARVRTIVENALLLCRQRFSAAGVRLNVGSIRDDLLIHCRPPEITSVLVSLIFNSFDAVQERAEKWIEISVKESGEGVEILVSDSGPGISVEGRKKLFIPFSTTKPPGKGVGLSLFFGRNVLNQHQGRLYLDDTQASTTFVIFVPRKLI